MRARHLAVLCVWCLAALLAAFAAVAAPRDAGPRARVAKHDAGAVDAALDASEEPPESTATAAPTPTPSAAPSAPPSAAPSAKPAAAATGEGSPVRLHDRRVFTIRAPRAGISEAERARRASAALERAFEENETGDVHVDESHEGLAIVLVGNRPIVELTQGDADAAGVVSLHSHAAAVGENVRAALKTERTRRDISKRVFAWSLIILSGLAAFFALRKARDLSASARAWIAAHPQRLPGLRVGSVEVMRPAAFQGTLRLGVSLLERAAQLGVLYVWVVLVLSQFERTKELGGKITTTILTPLGGLAGRIVLSLPLLAVSVVAALVVFLVVRFIRLFFRSVEVGETHLAWVPRDLAAATSAVLRIGVVVAAVVVGAPLITNSEQGSAARAGFVLLGALALGLVPIVASMSVGFSTVFGRRLAVGDFVSFDGRQGRITSLTLLEVRVLDGEGAELRIPHLLTLFRPLRVLGAYPLASFEVVVDPKTPQERVRQVMATAGSSKHGEPRVRLLAIDADGARYEIVAKRALDEEDPATAITRALLDAGIALGRSRGGS
jgi:hypothetical protein